MHIARSAVALVLALATPALADITFQGGITVDIAIDLTPLMATGNWSASLSSSTPTVYVLQYGDFAQSAITSSTTLGVANATSSAYGFSNAVGVSGYVDASSTANSMIGVAYVDQTYTLALDPLGLGNTPPAVILPLTITWTDDVTFTSTDAARDIYGDYFRSVIIQQLPFDQPGLPTQRWHPSPFIFDPLLGTVQGSSTSGVFSGFIVLPAGQTVNLSVQSRVTIRGDTLAVPAPWAVPVAVACLFTRRRRPR